MRNEALINDGGQSLVCEHHAVPIDVKPVGALKTRSFAKRVLHFLFAGVQPVLFGRHARGDLLPRVALDDICRGLVVAVAAKAADGHDSLLERVG